MVRLVSSAALPASLISFVLFAESSLAASLTKSECIQSRSAELAKAASCGHPGSLDYCFSIVPDDVDAWFLKQCYVNAGCTGAEALIEAEWTLKMCDDKSEMELRRRSYLEAAAAEGMPLVARATTTTSSTTSESSTSTSSTSTSTTSDSSSTSSTSTGSSSTSSGSTSSGSTTAASSSSSTTASSSTNSSSTSTTSTSTNTTLVCSTTTYVSTSYCPVQSTGTASGETLSCYPTTEPTETCAAGLLCLTDDTTGESGCMIPDGLGTSGTIMIVYFAVVVGVGIFAVCFASCREKGRTRKLQAQWEAATTAKAADSEAKKRRRSVLSTKGAYQPVQSS